MLLEYNHTTVEGLRHPFSEELQVPLEKLHLIGKYLRVFVLHEFLLKVWDKGFALNQEKGHLLQDCNHRQHGVKHPRKELIYLCN